MSYVYNYAVRVMMNLPIRDEPNVILRHSDTDRLLQFGHISGKGFSAMPWTIPN